jgi:hypothetical protein
LRKWSRTECSRLEHDTDAASVHMSVVVRESEREREREGVLLRTDPLHRVKSCRARLIHETSTTINVFSIKVIVFGKHRRSKLEVDDTTLAKRNLLSIKFKGGASQVNAHTRYLRSQ